jgi:hydrogenase nickel incorporation protein HypA/HybF
VHELAITQSIVDTITERLGPAPVHRVRLEIGKLSGVVPDAVRFSFELVTSGTTLDGAVLDIDEPAGSARCRSCGTDFPTSEVLPLCPCGSADVQVTGGDALRIRGVDYGEVGPCAQPADVPGPASG